MVIVIVLVPPSSSTTAKRSVWTPAHCPKTEKIKPLDYARSSRGPIPTSHRHVVLPLVVPVLLSLKRYPRIMKRDGTEIILSK